MSSTSAGTDHDAGTGRRSGGRAGRQALRASHVVEAETYLTRTMKPFEIVSDEGLEIIERNAETILHEVGVEIRDFDLERMGFSLSVLDETKKRQSSEAYLRMTLSELNIFLKALKSAEQDIDVSTVEPSGVSKLPTVKVSRSRDMDAPDFSGGSTLAAE